MKAALIHAKTAEIEEKLNKWLEENEESIAQIVNVTMSTHTVPGQASDFMIPWTNVVVIYKPKSEFVSA